MKYIILISLIIILASCASSKKTDSYADREAYRKVVRNNSIHYQNCYKELISRSSGTEGKLILSFDVNSKSEVENIVVDKAMSTLTEEIFVICMSNALKKAEFPASPKDTIVGVKYPFVFVNASAEK